MAEANPPAIPTSTASRSKQTQPETRYLVPVVLSTFGILRELSTRGSMGLNEIAQKTGIAKSTVFRILSTLHHLGYVLRDERRNYHLSRSLAELASDAGNAGALRKAALPHMLRLRDELGETVNLGQLSLDKVVYTEVVPSEYALRLSERPGATVSAHASSLGKAILAFSPPAILEGLLDGEPLPAITRNSITDPDAYRRELRRVRERGFAFDRGETSPLATCVGAPILDARGVAIAAMSISGPSSRFNPRIDSPVINALVSATRAISRQFGFPGGGARAGGAAASPARPPDSKSR